MASPIPAEKRAYNKKREREKPAPRPRVAVEPQPPLNKLVGPMRGTQYRCSGCGECFDAPDDHFMKSRSPLYYGWDGCVPLCKECAHKYYYDYVLPALGGDEKLAIEHLCQVFNWYWSEDIFNEACNYRDTTIARGAKTNLINAYHMKKSMVPNLKKGQTYLDTLKQNWERLQEEEWQRSEARRLEEEARQQREAEQAEAQRQLDEARRLEEEERQRELEALRAEEEAKKVIEPADVYFFGPGYTYEQYQYLREQYEDWIARYDAQTKAQEEIFKSICIAQLNVQRAQAEGDQRRTTDAMKTLQDLMDSARIKPKQKAGDALVEQNTFGTLIQRWENERPIPEPREEWRDVDGIGKAITVWFYGHLAKMFHLDNDAADVYEREVEKYTVKPPKYIGEDGGDDASFREKFNAMRGKKATEPEDGCSQDDGEDGDASS